MNDDERKPRFHIHTGGLIIFIIILLVLFKVDIVSKVQSPQFQKNITYITEQSKKIITDIVDPIKKRLIDFFVNTGNEQLKKVQDGISQKVFKQPTEADINNLTN